MLIRISVGLNGMLLVLGIFLAVQLNGLSKLQGTLTQRVTDLEVQNIQLAKRLEWASENGQSKMASSDRGRRQRQRSRVHVPARTPSVQPVEPMDGLPSFGSDVENLKADLRHEVEEMLSEQQASSREKRRQEWETRMREGMAQSLDDFAEDQNLDAEVKEQISTLLNDSMAQRQNLRRELESSNLSFYEYMKQERKIRGEMETTISEYLTDEQLQVFEEFFPLGPMGGGRIRGR